MATDNSAANAVNAVLDEFHEAASAADEERYLGCLAPDAVFLGTAPGERWAGADFHAFVHSFFSQGKGWTYVPSNRSVSIADDGRSAWFDERLDNDWNGECRGTGVLRLEGDRWRIEQYALSIPVPDEIAPEVVARIRAGG
jgi:ketosteroid isomerase-like protein